MRANITAGPLTGYGFWDSLIACFCDGRLHDLLKDFERLNESDVRKGLRKVTHLALFLGVVFFRK
jgi:hypothetical protein